jgi:hypothetical protein
MTKRQEKRESREMLYKVYRDPKIEDLKKEL